MDTQWQLFIGAALIAGAILLSGLLSALGGRYSGFSGQGGTLWMATDSPGLALGLPYPQQISEIKALLARPPLTGDDASPAPAWCSMVSGALPFAFSRMRSASACSRAASALPTSRAAAG